MEPKSAREKVNREMVETAFEKQSVEKLFTESGHKEMQNGENSIHEVKQNFEVNNIKTDVNISNTVQASKQKEIQKTIWQIWTEELQAKNN